MEFMIDLETMGTRPGCMVVSVGVVAFDAKKKLTLDEFYGIADLETQGTLKIEPGTTKWWMKQSDEARAVFDGDHHPLAVVLSELSRFFRNNGADKKDACVWGNGASFDLPILIAAYEAMGLPVPWFTFGDRCYRTVKNQRRDVKMERLGVHHNALDDAKSQTLHLFRIWEAQEAAIQGDSDFEGIY